MKTTLIITFLLLSSFSFFAAENVLFYTTFQAEEGWIKEGTASSSANPASIIREITDVTFTQKKLTLKMYRVGVEPDNVGKCTSFSGYVGRAQIQKDGQTYNPSSPTQTLSFKDDGNTGYIQFPPFDVDVQIVWTCDGSATEDRGGYVSTSTNGINWYTNQKNLAHPVTPVGACSEFTTPVLIPAGSHIRVCSHSSGGGIYFRTLKIREFIADNEPPSLVSSIPTESADNVSINLRNFSFTFSEPVKAGASGNAVVTNKKTNGIVATIPRTQLVFSSNSVSFSLPSNYFLENGTAYEIKIDKNAIQDFSENILTDDVILQFSTSGIFFGNEKQFILHYKNGRKEAEPIGEIHKIYFDQIENNKNVVVESKDGNSLTKALSEIERFYLFNPQDYLYTTFLVDAWSGKTARQNYVTRVLDSIRGFSTYEELPDVIKYGRDNDTEKLEATGFFRVQKIDERWWVIDPDGYQTYIRGISEFTSPNGTEYNGVRSPKRVAYQTKYGNSATWMAASADSLRNYGINHLGLGGTQNNVIPYNAANPGRPLSHTRNLSFMASYLSDMGLNKKDLSRTFDPEFVTYCDDRARSEIIETTYGGINLANDRNLFGYYADNELVFGLASLERYLNVADPADYGRVAAENWLVDNGYNKSLITDVIRNEFAAYEAEYYYTIVTAAIRKYDSNHLFLGSRLHGSSKYVTGVLQVENRFSDICSINHYGEWGLEPSTAQLWADNLPDKPFMITEFFAKGMDARVTYSVPNAPLFTNSLNVEFNVNTQKNRADFYEHFTLSLIENKQCIGFEVYKYTDDERFPLGVMSGEEASNKGVFNNDLVCWQPYGKSIQKINRNIYRLIEFFDKRP